MKRYIAFTLAVIAAMGLSACSKSKNSESGVSETTTAAETSEASADDTAAFEFEIPSRPAPVYSTATKTKYNALDYSFEISDDFSLELPNDPEEGYDGEYRFTGDKVTRISIESMGDINYSAEWNALESYRDIVDSGNFADVALEKLPVGDLVVYAYHYRYIEPSNEGAECISCYAASYQNRGFALDAWYTAANKDDVLPMLDDIARSLVYTSDYEMPTGPYNFETQYFLAKDIDPMWNVTGMEESPDEDGRLTGLEFGLAQCKTNEEFSIKVRLTMYKQGGKSPAERADASYDSLSKKESDLVKYVDIERSQQKILGCDSESMCYGAKFTDLSLRMKTYWFEKDGYVYELKLCTDLEDTSHDKAIDELIGTITIK